MGDELEEDPETAKTEEDSDSRDSATTVNEPRNIDDVGDGPTTQSPLKDDVSDELFAEKEEKPEVQLMMPEIVEDEEHQPTEEAGEGKPEDKPAGEGAEEGITAEDEAAKKASGEEASKQIAPGEEGAEVVTQEGRTAEPTDGTTEPKAAEEEEADEEETVIAIQEGGEAGAVSREKTVQKKKKKATEVSTMGDEPKEKGVKKAPSIDYDMAPRYHDEELDILDRSPSGDFDVVESDVSLKFYSNAVEEEEEEDNEIVQEEEAPRIDREPYLERYKELQAQMAVSKIKNCILQKKLAIFFKRRKMDHVLKEPEQQFDTQQKYGKKLDQYGELTELDATQRKAINEELTNLKAKREAKFEELTKMFKNMQNRELEIGTGLIHSKTGNPIPDKLIEKLLRRQKTQMETVSSMRLNFIQLKEMVNEKQEAISLLDNIGEGLHLMDYEQLKVENRSFADKIEERDEELTRLRFKCQNTIQILAHIREKSHALDCDNDDLKDDLALAEGHQMQCRERLNDMKQQRDLYRNQTMKLKDESGLLLQPELLRDMEDSIDELEKAKSFLENLQNQSKTISKQIRNIRKNMEYSEVVVKKSTHSTADKKASKCSSTVANGRRQNHIGMQPELPEDAFDYLRSFYPDVQHNSNKKK